MATVTGLTAERMLEIEAASIVNGRLEDGDLILIKHDGTEINVGPVEGPQGSPGPPGVNALPGEIKLWPGDTLPALETYGKWVWADGAYYPIVDHPLAAAHIADAWRTFAGASDPGEGNFRVPDLRGLVAAGMDAMPDGTRANRMTRGAAIILAEKTGKETHILQLPESPSHTHTSVGGHQHTAHSPGSGNVFAVNVNVGEGFLGSLNANELAGWSLYKEAQTAYGDIGLNPAGGGQAHENVQPTVFIPYIVNLDT